MAWREALRRGEFEVSNVSGMYLKQMCYSSTNVNQQMDEIFGLRAPWIAELDRQLEAGRCNLRDPSLKPT